MRCEASAIENVVSLDELLEGYDSRFRLAVRETLASEGFEFGGELPDLQLAGEIRGAIGWGLAAQGFEADWETLQRFLEWAGRQGVLVDLSRVADG